MTSNQIKLTLGLIDHESAGTWSPTIVNHTAKEYSTGIAQWNQYAGRYAQEGFEAQAQQIVDEMSDKFKKYSDLIAVTKHNCPRCNNQIAYTAKVKASSNQFIQ
jgi:uncharacterized protein YeaO (DUF488 family)